MEKHSNFCSCILDAQDPVALLGVSLLTDVTHSDFNSLKSFGF